MYSRACARHPLEPNVMRNPVQIAKHQWLKFPEDLAWDIFTLICMLIVVLAMLVAGLASCSTQFAELIADHERWLWVSAIPLAILAAISLVRVIWPREGIIHRP